MMRRCQHGFTLVEILVAMAVIAFPLAALISASGQSTSNAASLRDRTYAQWVAANALTELRLDPDANEPGRRNGDEEMANARWRWQAAITTTPDPNLLRIDVEVSLVGEEGSMVVLTGFKKKPGPPPAQDTGPESEE